MRKAGDVSRKEIEKDVKFVFTGYFIASNHASHGFEHLIVKSHLESSVAYNEQKTICYRPCKKGLAADLGHTGNHFLLRCLSAWTTVFMLVLEYMNCAPAVMRRVSNVLEASMRRLAVISQLWYLSDFIGKVYYWYIWRSFRFLRMICLETSAKIEISKNEETDYYINGFGCTKCKLMFIYSTWTMS